MTQTLNVAEVAAASGSVVDIRVGRIVLGGVTIGQLTLQDTSVDINSGSAFLQNVRTIVTLDFSLDWWWDIGIDSDSGTSDLGSLSFPFNLGNVSIPTLNNIPLTIPSIVGHNVTASVAPITGLDLGGGSFSGVKVASVALPQGGFTLTGLQVASVELASVDVPKMGVSQVTVQDFHPNANLTIPALQLGPIALPSASAGNIATTNPISFNGTASSRSLPEFSVGVFGFTIKATPRFFASIGSVLLNGVTLSLNVKQALLNALGVPVDVQDIQLSTVNVDNIVATSITLS